MQKSEERKKMNYDNDYDLRKLQLVETEMLKDFKAICEKHNLKYYLASGTLLGAVRHKGFIPWDNDIDVEMPYDDWIRFMSLSQEEIGPKYFIQSTDTEHGWYRAYGRLRLNNTTMMYEYFRKYNVHHGIWLDIFPLVEINDGFEFKFKRFMLKLAIIFNMEERYYAVSAVEYEKSGKKTRSKYDLFYIFLPRKLRKRWAKKILDRIYKAKNKKNYSLIWCDIAKTMPKSFYEGEPTQLEFEGEMFSVVPKYHEWLTRMYGNYMTPPPEDERATHDGLYVDFDNDYTVYMDA